MKLISTLAIILILTVSGYSQTNTDSLMNAFIPEKKTAIIHLKKTIKLNSNDSINPDFEITDGSRILFEYEYRSKDIIAMSDDEMMERLVFSVNANRKSFDFSDLELKDTRMLFTQSCFCMDAGNYVIKSGRVVGKKINKNTWKVKIKINYIARNSGIKVTKTFNLTYKIK
jgi:hypothetical protein